MLYFFLTLIVGGVFGLFAGFFLNVDVPGGVTGEVVIGFL